MVFNLAIKTIVSLTIGMVYWFWAFLMFMVYSFMPINKESHSIIFAVIAPLLYLGLTNWVLKKLFKENELNNKLINLAITVTTMLLSAGAIDLIGRVVR